MKKEKLANARDFAITDRQPERH
jgi:hypothetical protein